MMELFDMGKYNVYVWSSIGIFLIALIADFISTKKHRNHIKRLIVSKAIKAKNRTQTNKQREQA